LPLLEVGILGFIDPPDSRAGYGFSLFKWLILAARKWSILACMMECSSLVFSHAALATELGEVLPSKDQLKDTRFEQ